MQRFFNKKKVPPESVLNGFVYNDIPAVVLHLNSFEEHLVALNVTFIHTLKRPAGGQLSCKGCVVNLPNCTSKSIKVLICSVLISKDDCKIST